MLGKKIVIVGLSFLLLAGLLSPLAAAENDSLHVVMTVEDRKYSVGDTITIQFRIYDKGVETDLHDIWDAYLGMSTNPALQNPVNITLSHQGTGIYQGTYTVRSADSNRRLYFFYEVTRGTDYEEGRGTIRVYSIQDTVDMTIGGQKEVPAKPGDALIATVLVRTGGTPIPITGFTHLYVEAPGGTRQNLTHTIRDVGIYDVNFIVPVVSVSGTYELVAEPIGVGRSDSVYVHANVLDVWYRKVSTAGNTVSFEVCVANNEGEPVEGANIYIRRDGRPRDEYFGVTDMTGKHLMHVPDIIGAVGFSGHVIAGGQNQTITGTVLNPVPEQPHHSDFDIVWEGGRSVFKSDTQVTIPYGAYDARVPASGKTVFYYVTARGTDFALLGNPGDHIEIPREVIAVGSAVTDELGKFDVAFRTPARQCAIHITLEVPLDRSGFANQNYDLDDDMYYAQWPRNATHGFIFHAYEGRLEGDKGVSLKVARFNPGSPGQVTIELDAALGDPVHVLWAVGETKLEEIDNYDPEWMRWVPGGHTMPLREDQEGRYHGEFLLPAFIEDQEVTVAAGYVDSVGVPHFDVETVSPGGLPWLWIILLIVIIVAVIVTVYVAKEKMVF